MAYWFPLFFCMERSTERRSLKLELSRIEGELDTNHGLSRTEISDLARERVALINRLARARIGTPASEAAK